MKGSDDSERGSGTALALGLCAVILVLAVFIGGLMSVMLANQRASSAADLSALIAADTVRGLREGEPCETAARVASDNGAELLACNAPAGLAGTMDVRVQVPITGVFGFLGAAESVARAGPPG